MHPELQGHPEYFTKEIVPLADNVYQAFGFAASNVYMIVGDDGVVIVDTSESTTAAEAILAEFRKITDLPVKTIILTHSHRDHISGARIFAEGGSPEILTSDKWTENPLTVASSNKQAAKPFRRGRVGNLVLGFLIQKKS
ncbi:MAG: MBL fold metallo-hydrolase [Rhizobiaceae bacterium]|nr:MBL fold metallo-hydrolase [Rhizobiaceae bacterium]